MIELHGGRIEVESELGDGARFVLTLPHVFPSSTLPDLSTCSDGRLLVLSASKQNALLLEGILVEAGLVHVEKEWTAPGDRHALPRVVVVDAQVPPRETLSQISSHLKAVGIHPAWIFVGNAVESAALAGWVDGEPQRIGIPLNPLIYLKRVEALLGAGGQTPETQGRPVMRVVQGSG
jgi:hypothetical protein